MLYNANNPVLRIIGIEHLRLDGGVFEVPSRAYSALAFRIHGKAAICSGENEYCINTNDILYMPQNISYTAQYTDTEMLVIHFITAQNDPAPQVYSFGNVEQVYKLFLQAHALWQNKEPGFAVYAMAQLYMILGVIQEKSAETNQPRHFLDAISFINANYKNSDLSIDMICAGSGINATVFRQLFNQYYQKTPIQYITELRLEYARNLISTGTPIENAAYEGGFNDSKYFARVVKKHFGCTPRELKNYGK